MFDIKSCLKKVAAPPELESLIKDGSVEAAIANASSNIAMNGWPIIGAMGPSGVAISDEEVKELKQLEIEYDYAVKIAKLKTFKDLSSEIRQILLNSWESQAAINSINNASVPQSDRLVRLKANKISSQSHSQGYMLTANSLLPYYKVNTIVSLPEGLSLEELKQAHVEQSFDEEVLDGKA